MPYVGMGLSFVAGAWATYVGGYSTKKGGNSGVLVTFLAAGQDSPFLPLAISVTH